MLPKRLNIIIVFLIFIAFSGFSQRSVITLDESIESAINKHPLNGQRNLLASKSELEIKGLKKHNLPDIDWTAQASIQSENISLEFPLPNFEPIELPLYKAQTNLESNYLLYDGGITNSLIENAKLKLKINQQNINTQLFNLKSKVVDIYFSILLINKQKEILDSSLSVFNVQEDIVQTAIRNGVALKSDLDKIGLEKIKIKQNISKLSNAKKTLQVVFFDLTGIEIENKKLELSQSDYIDSNNWISRPELLLLSMKKDILNQSKDIIDAKKKPKVFLFARVGVGYPNPFNFFDDNIAPYAFGGVKFKWNIWDWNKTRLDKQKLEIEKLTVENQKEIFDDKMKLETNKLISEINGLESDLHFDKEIIEKQKSVVKTLKNQYINGVITISDYITEQNKQRIAEITAAINKLKIEKLKFKLKVFVGN